MTKPLRVGVVGAGDNTRTRHLPGLKAIDAVEIVSVCNRSAESSARVAGAFGIPKVYDSWRTLVDADDTDAIVIGTWPYLHAPVTLAALAAGKHVLCEARMAMNAAEARAMLSASRTRPDLVCQIVPSPMTLPLDRTVLRLLAEGAIGRIISVEAALHEGHFTNATAPMTWRQNESFSGRNVMNLGIWYEAVSRWVGPATSVQAAGQTVVSRRVNPETGVLQSTCIPDQLFVVCELAAGGTALFSVSTVCGGAHPQQVVLYGTEGTLTVQPGRLALQRSGAKTAEEVSGTPEERIGWQVETDFVRSIREHTPVTRTSFEDGVRYMELTEAAWLSMQEGRRIALPLPSLGGC